MNNLLIGVPGKDGVLEVTPHGVSMVSDFAWSAYSSFIVWSGGEFFHLERDDLSFCDGLEYAGLYSSVASIAHRGLSRFYCTEYHKTLVYRIEHLGRSERLIVITSMDDYGCIVYPSGARYDGFAARLVDDFVVFSVYHSGCLFEAEYVFDSEFAGERKALLCEACREAVLQDYCHWEMNSVFDGKRELYRVRRML